MRNVLHDESPAELRRLALGAYAVGIPSLLILIAVAVAPGDRLPALLPVAILAAAGLAWLYLVRAPGPGTWIVPAGIVPTVCFGFGLAATGASSLAFAGVLGAPLAWSAVLFGAPTVIAAWLTASLTFFVTDARHVGIVVALGHTIVFALVQGAVAWVIYGKSWRHRAARLLTLERQVNDIEFVLRTDGRIVDANDRAVAAYGRPREELVGLDVRDIRAPDAHAFATRQLEALQQREHVVFETEHRRRDGSLFPVEVSARVFRRGGETLIHSLVRDITERRRAEESLRASEQRYRSVVTLMAEGVVVQDAGGAVVTCNAAAERILGLSLEQMLGHTSIDPRGRAIRADGSPFPGEEHPPMITLRTGETVANTLMGIRLPDGLVRWITVSSQPVPLREGDADGVVSTFADVTALREHADRLRDALGRNERVVTELKKALLKVKALRGLIPICAWCKKIRNDEGYWQQVEQYLGQHTQAEISHGVCPECCARVLRE